MNQKAICSWTISDGKAGHVNQSKALVKGLSKHLNITSKEFTLEKSFFRSWIEILKIKYYGHRPFPEIVIGAGRRTHLVMVFCKLVFSAKIICIMRPSIPKIWLDLLIVPKHDDVKRAKNVIETEGPLTLIEQTGPKHKDAGLILLGGDSSHYVWDNESLLSQIEEITKGSDDNIRWTLTTSRRTPEKIKTLLTEIEQPNFHYEDVGRVKANWLANELESSQYVWVTPDSISMTYESLSAGCQVGIFNLSKKRESRVTKNQQRLVEEGKIRTLQNKTWQPVQCLNERDRIGRLIATRWPSLTS